MSWSEMQREDFLPVLMQAYQPKDHLNGLVGSYESLSSQGRRPSLFDCQVCTFVFLASWIIIIAHHHCHHHYPHHHSHRLTLSTQLLSTKLNNNV